MRTYPFSAVVGADDMALALLLTTVSPEVGGVLIRGEKGTAKSTMVRALAALLPDQLVVAGCRFGCDPHDPDPTCPDGPHDGVPSIRRPARLVELPVGATEDRVIGSLDLEQALGSGQVRYEPGLLAAANRGLLYVDEVNLLHDHLVDLLLDAAAMGRSTVEREGVSVAHAARLVLVGTMNPEEGELRPQLLDRFGLTVEVAAPRGPEQRAEVVRRRLAYEADPAAFLSRFAVEEAALQARIVAAQRLLPDVELSDEALTTIATVCAGFEVDGMRADLVTARAAVAHAAWQGRTTITRADIRAAARLALPHRRRRNPFDAPGLDEDLLEELLGEDEPEPDGPPPDGPPPDGPQTPPDGSPDHDNDASTDPAHGSDQPPSVAAAGDPYRTRLLAAPGHGSGTDGRRSRALTSAGRTVGASGSPQSRRMHVPATIRAAAPHQDRRGRTSGPLRFRPTDLRRAVVEGRESNLVLFCVDASGSMAARRRMTAVKTAVLSLLLDAYQRRDKVGLVTFRGAGATLALPPTSSVDVAARRLAELPSGGRTPLAEGLLMAAETLERERVRDPRRRPLLVVVTDGRATAGADPITQSHRAAELLRRREVAAVVIDCENGPMRFGLAGDLAVRLGADRLTIADLNADALIRVAAGLRSSTTARGAA